MRLFVGSLLVILGVALAPAALAGPVAARVKAEKLVRCGSVERPGLAQVSGEKLTGLLVDLCRAVAVATLGPQGRAEFTLYQSAKGFDAIRQGRDEVFFLTGGEIAEQNLADQVLLGPSVFYLSHAIMVPESSPIQHIGEFTDQNICSMAASGAERALEIALASKTKSWVRSPFSEMGEMVDAYNVHHCDALADEITSLAALRRGSANLANRILPEPLSAFPVVAATGLQDAEWSAIVAATFATLLNADRPESPWLATGFKSFPIRGAGLKLAADWQAQIVQAVGRYRDIHDRNLGEGSALKLPRGLNADWSEGGLLAPPYRE